MFLTTRVLHLAEGALLRSWTSGVFAHMSRRTETRVNVPASTAGSVEFHPLDSQHARRVHFGVWRFDELLDLGVLQVALERAIARYPPVAGWLEGSGRGRMWIKWDAAATGRGVVFVTAEARGAAPDGPYDGVCLQDRGLLPPMRGHCMMSVQATHFTDTASTLMVVSVDHAVTDVSGLMDFLATWCHACSDIKGDSTTVRTTIPLPPAPVWDRSLLLPAGGSQCSSGLSRTPSDAATLTLSSCDDDNSEGFSLEGSDWAAAAPTAQVVLSSPTDSAGVKGDVVSPCPRASLSSCTDSEDVCSVMTNDAIHADGLLGAADHAHKFWDGPAIWARDPLSASATLVLATRYLYLNPECRSQTWMLPRSAITALKTSLGGDLGPKGPTANDLVSALLLAATAARQAATVARRGGVNLQVVVNGRGGRFGLNVPDHYFGNVSFVVPVWIPAALLLPSDGSAPSGIPTPELVAHVHTAVRAALGPDGITALRAEWMAAAHGAGVSARVRTHEIGDFFDGDVGVDNVSNYPVYDLRFGAAAAPSSANLRFFLCPRLAWITAAGPAGPTGGASAGDLNITVTLPRSVWEGVDPVWRAAGMQQVRDQSAVHDVAMHPAGLRSMFAELFRSPLRRLG